MPQEEKEELNPQEETLETAEQAPAEEEVPAEQPETELPKGIETPEGEEAPLIEEQVTISKSEHDQLLKDSKDKDNYKKGFLAEKGFKREKELNLTEEILQETPDAQRDYLSKRVDSMAEFKSKIAQLSDEEYSVFKRHFKGSESALLNENKSWISRKEINDIFTDALEFAYFKTKLVITDIDGDIGSTKTIRKIMSTPKISERARALQPHTKVNKQTLSLEKIQGMLDRGEIN